MRKIVGCLALMFMASMVMAKGADITSATPTQTVVISNTAWTAIPAQNRVDHQRIAIQFDLDNSCTDYMLIIYSTMTASPNEAKTVGMKYEETDPPWILPISRNINVFGIIKGKDAENLYLQQLRGKF